MPTAARRHADRYESAELNLEEMTSQLRAVARGAITTYSFGDKSKLVVETFRDRDTNELRLSRIKCFDHQPRRDSSAHAEMMSKVNER
jgi:hypothetical protein